MKISGGILFTVFTVNFFFAQNAEQYLGMVDKEMQSTQQATWRYVKVSATARPAKIEKRREELFFAIGDAISNLSSFPSYQGDNSLRDSAISYLSLSRAVMIEDFGAVTDLAPIAENAFDAMEAFVAARKQGNQRLKIASENVGETYRLFAANHGFSVSSEPGRHTQQLQRAAAVYEHYDKIYQLFFNNYKQEKYFYDALHKNDVSGIGQNCKALEACSQNALVSLNNMPSCGWDKKIKDACRDLLEFYNQESAFVMRDAADFFVDKNNIEKLHTAYLARRNEEPEPDQQQKYLASILTYSARAQQFENKYSTLAKKRESLLRSWNKACATYLRKNIR